MSGAEILAKWADQDYDWDKTLRNIREAAAETVYTSSISFVVIVILGIAIGIVLYVTSPSGVAPFGPVYRVIGAVVNIIRALPFIILVVAIIPLTRLIVGTYLGPTAAIVPIVISSVPFVARLVESTLLNVTSGKIEAARSSGATRIQIVVKVLLPESVPGIIALTTFAAVAVVSNSAMVGAVGGGGLGSLALTYGYQRFDYAVMAIAVVLLIALVQALQSFGDLLTSRATRRTAGQ